MSQGNKSIVIVIVTIIICLLTAASYHYKSEYDAGIV